MGDDTDFKEAERMLNEFKENEFQLPLEKMKREVVKVKGVEMYKDLYLCQHLFPALLQGLEELSRQVEEHMQNSGDIDPEVAGRFNPCIFLGQYLMRNNQNTKQGVTTTLNKLFKNYVRQESFSRYFLSHFDSISRIFIRSLKKDKKVCDLAEMKVFARDLDEALGFGGQLKDWLNNSKHLTRKGEIKLTQIVDEIARFSAHNAHITQQHFQVLLKKK